MKATSLLQSLYPKVIILSLISGVIYGFFWNAQYFFFLETITLIPFFIALKSIYDSTNSFGKRLLSLLLSVFFFRGGFVSFAMDWMFEVSIGSLMSEFLAEVFFLTITLIPLLFRKLPFISVVFLLCLYEFWMQNNILLTPYALLGNGWGNHIELIQYYSILGIEGGSLLMYLVNFAIFDFILLKKTRKFDVVVLSFLGLVTLFSLSKFYFSKDMPFDHNQQITMIHGEIKDDVHDSLTKDYVAFIDSINKVTPDQSLIAMPEGFFNNFGWLADLTNQFNPSVALLDSLRIKRGQAFLVGANIYSETKYPNPQSRFIRIGNRSTWYNTHNVSIFMSDGRLGIKSKQVFIPFQEYVPDNIVAQWVNKHVHIVGSDLRYSPLQRYDHFRYKGKPFEVLLCYESVFPLLAAKRAKESVFQIIIANESWSAGIKKGGKENLEYFNINKAIAIQNGLPLYRSSNFGYTTFIQPNGKSIFLYNTGSQFSSLSAYLPDGDLSSSFYTYIAGWSYWLSLIMLIVLFSVNLFKSKETIPKHLIVNRKK